MRAASLQTRTAVSNRPVQQHAIPSAKCYSYCARGMVIAAPSASAAAAANGRANGAAAAEARRRCLLSACRRNNNVRAAAAQDAAAAAPAGAVVATEGDIVTIHFEARSAEGELVESTRGEGGEPLTFEVGAGDVMGNPIFRALDGAVRGLPVGGAVELELSGGDWRPELLFTVPRDHPEVERLEGRYKNVGGLAEGLVVELSNGRAALLLEVGEDAIKLDANNLGAGKTLVFQVELLDIAPAGSPAAAAAAAASAQPAGQNE